MEAGKVGGGQHNGLATGRGYQENGFWKGFDSLLTQTKKAEGKVG